MSEVQGTLLDATGLEFEFVTLSEINVRPCFACKRCVSDNVCKSKSTYDGALLTQSSRVFSGFRSFSCPLWLASGQLSNGLN
jgi:hypothetical protein